MDGLYPPSGARLFMTNRTPPERWYVCACTAGLIPIEVPNSTTTHSRCYLFDGDYKAVYIVVDEVCILCSQVYRQVCDW